MEDERAGMFLVEVYRIAEVCAERGDMHVKEGAWEHFMMMQNAAQWTTERLVHTRSACERGFSASNEAGGGAGGIESGHRY